MQGRVAVTLLAALALWSAAPPAAAAKAVYSKLWGKDGELWDPAGPLPDFSYAGYKQGNEPLPSPPVSRSVLDFKKPGMTDTEMFVAAVNWANRRPLTDKFIVLYIPPGTYTLTQRLWLTRSRLVLRGAGTDKTVLYIPKSLTDLYGPNKQNPRTGGYVNTDAFVTIRGHDRKGPEVARVNKFAAKGDQWVRVDKPGALKAGEYYDTWWTDVAGKFNNYMFDDEWKAPKAYVGSTRVMFTTRVLAVRKDGFVKLERHLPYEIRSKLNVVAFHKRPSTLFESGVEGITFRFKWSLYAGHHCEAGWNAVEVSDARDCWVRDIATINADSSVLINGASAIHVDGLTISVTKTRANNIPNRWHERADADGHWGCQHTHSFDCMITNVRTTCSLLHDVGTGSSGKFSVFMNCKMDDGNLDLHRALAGPTLYTNIDVGLGNNGLYSGGPSRSGPNALAGTTWWNIESRKPLDPNKSNRKPGDCSYGPVINLVGLNLKARGAKTMCKTWLYERYVNTPANLYSAQYARRMRLAASAATNDTAPPA